MSTIKSQQMKKILSIIVSLLPLNVLAAQDNVYPAKEYKGLMFIKNGTVHIGNGQVIENCTIQINNGKIEKVAPNLPIPADNVKVIDATGKHVLSETRNASAGLNEFSVDISRLARGLYLVQIETNDQKVVRKLVKE